MSVSRGPLWLHCQAASEPFDHAFGVPHINPNTFATNPPAACTDLLGGANAPAACLSPYEIYQQGTVIGYYRLVEHLLSMDLEGYATSIGHKVDLTLRRPRRECESIDPFVDEMPEGS